MNITLIQTRLCSVLNQDTNKRELVPSKVWRDLDEIDECIDVDIDHLIKHHILAAAHQMGVSEQECEKYFRIKEVERLDDKDHWSRWKQGN